jgi:hypothetical protein
MSSSGNALSTGRSSVSRLALADAGGVTRAFARSGAVFGNALREKNVWRRKCLRWAWRAAITPNIRKAEGHVFQSHRAHQPNVSGRSNHCFSSLKP